MNDDGKSDSSVVPKKLANEAKVLAKESVEERELAKGNWCECDGHRMQGRVGLQNALTRVREAARRDRQQQLTALLHHIYDVGRLRKAYEEVRADAAAGPDGMTWKGYGRNLRTNLEDLADRLKRRAYRPSPVRRAFIPKADGRLRPLGVPALEDKIVQRATVEVLNAIYEEDFLGFSYGFRPGRSQHHALDALYVGLQKRKVNWVLDADIRSFFDTLSHEWLLKFIEYRIGDKRVVRLIEKWLRAGVLEDGKRIVSEEGTVQGGSISPLLANIYLHYVFDVWASAWRKKARGDVIIVRYADDFIVGFQHRHEAEQFLGELKQRLADANLELHPEKTRLIEFGRFAAERRNERGGRKPETFNFLGFTHICGKSREGWFTVKRQTMRKKVNAKLAEVKERLRREMHRPFTAQGKYLRAVLDGHYRYYGVPTNYSALTAFRWALAGLWWRVTRRRSQKPRTWTRMQRLIERWLPRPRICHPHPTERLCVAT
jgi:RNA-directed DNA polymerase